MASLKAKPNQNKTKLPNTDFHKLLNSMCNPYIRVRMANSQEISVSRSTGQPCFLTSVRGLGVSSDVYQRDRFGEVRFLAMIPMEVLVWKVGDGSRNESPPFALLSHVSG